MPDLRIFSTTYWWNLQVFFFYDRWTNFFLQATGEFLDFFPTIGWQISWYFTATKWWNLWFISHDQCMCFVIFSSRDQKRKLIERTCQKRLSEPLGVSPCKIGIVNTNNSLYYFSFSVVIIEKCKSLNIEIGNFL